MSLTIYDQSCPPGAYLFWDTLWDSETGAGQWLLTGPGETGNRGGLAASRPLETAVVIALFTDRRCPADHPLAHLVEDGDPRGWWGDGVDVRPDLGETPLGSLLWLLERATASDENANWARAFAEEALAPLRAAGLFASFTVEARTWPDRNTIALAVALFGRDGRKAHSQQFDLFWTPR